MARAGWPEDAPYDRIELTVGATDITPAWYEQLVEGGVMTLPLWLGISDASVALRKRDGRPHQRVAGPMWLHAAAGGEKSDVQWIALGNGLRVGSDDAKRLAEPIKELLAARPRRRLHLNADPTLMHWLGLRGLRLVVIGPDAQRRSFGRPRVRYGVYAEGADGPSLSVFAARIPILFSFGGIAAERQVIAETARWQTTRRIPIEQWRITAWPHYTGVEPPPPPAGIYRQMRRYFTYDIAIERPSGSPPRESSPWPRLPARPLRRQAGSARRSPVPRRSVAPGGGADPAQCPRAIIELIDDVARLDARLLRRAAIGHLNDLDGHLFLGMELAAERLRQHARLRGDTHHRTTHLAVLHQPRRHPVDGVDRDGEREALRLLNHRDVDADDRARRIDQRPARVAGIDRGVGLDDILDHLAAVARQGAVKRADDASGDGALQAHRAANGDDELPHLELIGVAQPRRAQMCYHSALRCARRRHRYRDPARRPRP